MPVDVHQLTVEVSRINATDFSGVNISISLVDPMLAVAGMPTETILPSTLTGITDSDGVFTINLVPSSIVGNYMITLTHEDAVTLPPKIFTMPENATRLSALPDLTEEA